MSNLNRFFSMITGSSTVQDPNNTVLSGTLLASNAEWVGTAIDITSYVSLSTASLSDQPGTFTFEFSADGTNWDILIPNSAPAAGTTNPLTGVAFPSPTIVTTGIRAKWFRVRFKNTGPSTQTVFRLWTLLNPTTVEYGASRPTSGYSLNALAPTVKASVFGVTTAGGATPLRFNTDTFPRALVDVGTPAVTVSGSVATTQSDRTEAFTTGTLDTTVTLANQVIASYTVPTGKTFYLGGADVSAQVPGLLGNVLVGLTLLNIGSASLQIGGVSKWTVPLNGQVVDTKTMPHPVSPIAIPAGTVVRLVCTPGAATLYRWRGNIVGAVN